MEWLNGTLFKGVLGQEILVDSPVCKSLTLTELEYWGWGDETPCLCLCNLFTTGTHGPDDIVFAVLPPAETLSPLAEDAGLITGEKPFPVLCIVPTVNSNYG